MSPIHWRPILWVGLTWFFIIQGPAACSRFPASHRCNPLILSTCE